MGDDKNQEKQNPGYIDQEQKKRENERAGQNPYDKDQASNPERQKKQDPQYDPSHIQEDPTRESRGLKSSMLNWLRSEGRTDIFSRDLS